MVSGTNTHSTNITIEALESGAFEFISKPESQSPAQSKQILIQELRPVINLVRAKTRRFGGVAASPPPAKPAIPAPSPSPSAPVKPPAKLLARTDPPTRNVFLIAIGVSTGGPKALLDMIPHLSSKINRPVLIVQHMPPNFTKSLAGQLDKRTELTVMEAEDGNVAEPGNIYIAPGGRHMVARIVDEKVVLSVNDNPPVKSCRPSVDVLFPFPCGHGEGKHPHGHADRHGRRRRGRRACPKPPRQLQPDPRRKDLRGLWNAESRGGSQVGPRSPAA